MIATLILWSHALAALLFGSMALREWQRPRDRGLRATFVAALVLTALWALAVAGIDPRDLAARVAESGRDIAWLIFLLALARRSRTGGRALTAVYMTVMVVAALAGLLAVAEAATTVSEARGALATARALFGMMATVSALVLVHHVGAAASGTQRGAVRLIAIALAAMWSMDFLLFASVYVSAASADIVLVRGGVTVVGALILAVAAQRRGEWTLALSRPAAMRSLAAVAVIVYAGGIAWLTSLAAALGGAHARSFQAAIVFGATATLLTLLSTSWLRAWAKVKVAKHLFRHRYDYRTEWQRFTATLGRSGDGSAPLHRRVVQAMADLTDSPAGLLLVPDGSGLGHAAAWNWDGPGSGAEEAFAAYLAASGRIIELDAVRADRAPVEERACVPDWLIAASDAWAIAPLLHNDALVGAVVLARPPVDRALDWEDFDLLRVAGRQAASYLAEDRAHAALADAERFDEFNRRFAFILHDIKNLVSQLSLVARNAERHADNPEFRADMVATLNDSATRMNALLARLSQHGPAPDEPLAAIDLAALAERVARARRAQHPIRCQASARAVALAHPTRLEQVLGHLVQNAVEASAADAAITLSVQAVEGHAVIEVIDHGCGMTPAFVRDQLFRPFVSSKPGGFGIGACEARQLVRAMGGTLAVASQPGEGSRFRVTLPLAPAMEVAA